MIPLLPLISFSLALSADSLTHSPPDSEIAVLHFAGDFLPAAHYEAAAGDSPAVAFENFPLFLQDDFTIVNQECPITDRGVKTPKPYNFRMRPDYRGVYGQTGIELVNLANNHVYDYGEEGLFDTISYLDSVGTLHIGAGRTAAEARKPAVIALKGHRIGFLGYYGGGEAPVAGRTTPGVAPRNLDIIRRDLALLRETDSVDFSVVTLHWGTEKAEEPDSGQQLFARGVIDAGADLVVGHHPHILQGIESYHHGVIAYSLGNFIFGGNSRASYETAVLELNLSDEGAEYKLIPVGVRNWRLRVLEGPERDAVIKSVSDRSKIFSNSIFQQKENP
jgi:poly-gamma-glutamate synthesis protein (capsule biosynthesis protein)